MFEILAKRLDVFQCVVFSIPCISVILDSKYARLLTSIVAEELLVILLKCHTSC